jgi:hypothetical protein
MTRIIKSHGVAVEFDPNKVRGTLERAGAQPETVEKVLASVRRKARDGMTTRELFKIIRAELRRFERHTAQRYNLRKGLLRLGPAGFRFEQYVAAVLTAYQYKTRIPSHDLAGMCVDHEIDVMASRQDKTVMIEAKFRNRFGDTVTLKDTMATWSRFGDLVDGAKAGKCPRFDEVWIVTNGRFSDRALQFGVCKGMHMVGWGPEEHSFARLVDHAYLYPITVIDYLRSYDIERFSKHGIMLCSEVAKADPNRLADRLELEPSRMDRLISDCQKIITQTFPAQKTEG